ncbi:MAG: ATP-binding protein [Nocardiopsaceae bacterium]|nr:ATP-binding protein [Nocardiopsaceae bacterium]
MRAFNVGGVCEPERHYMLPPEPRIPGARAYVDRWDYFVVHAPRQTGKTTTIRALARHLTAEGRHAALAASCERAGEVGDDIGAASAEVLESIRNAAARQLPERLQPPAGWPDAPPGSRIFTALQDWALACPLPLVLLLDEIDSMRGPVLRSVLRQLRDGHQYRANAFPASVVLCGMRDVRDYKAASGGNPDRLSGPSPFNVAVDSIRIGDFTPDEVAVLYAQHTAETGQEFTPEAVERAFGYSQGQPWLVNAIAREIVDPEKMAIGVPVTAGHVDTAKERLIGERAFHLDSLADKLREPRVKRFIEPLLAGTGIGRDDAYNDDLQYVRDLGLIARDAPIRVANPVYREVIVRSLTEGVQEQVTLSPQGFLLPDGRIDFRMLLEEFADWWVANGEFMTRTEVYHEAAAQLIFMGFLQRIVNGGGFVDREYGVGSGRTDILVRKPYGDRQVQREAIELKAWSKGKEPLGQGLRQLDRYLDQLRLDTGTLIIFDRREDAPDIAERTAFSKETSPAGREITLLRA